MPVKKVVRVQNNSKASLTLPVMVEDVNGKPAVKKYEIKPGVTVNIDGAHWENFLKDRRVQKRLDTGALIAK